MGVVVFAVTLPPIGTPSQMLVRAGTAVKLSSSERQLTPTPNLSTMFLSQRLAPGFGDRALCSLLCYDCKLPPRRSGGGLLLWVRDAKVHALGFLSSLSHFPGGLDILWFIGEWGYLEHHGPFAIVNICGARTAKPMLIGSTASLPG